MKKTITATLIAFAMPAAAQFMTGNQLLSRCESETPIAVGVCFGYVQAVFDVNRNDLCTRGPVSVRQVSDVVTAHLRAYPETRNQDADVLAERAMKAAWPCPSNANPNIRF